MTAIDPSVMTVADVEAWVEANWHDHRNDSTFVAVHNAERDGKARVSLLDWLDHFAEDHDIDLTPTPRIPGLPITLNPNTSHVDDPDFVISVIGVGFNDTSVIVWGGGDEPTTFVSPTEVTTVVKPSTAGAPRDIEVHIRTTVTDEEDVETDEDSGSATFTFLAKVIPPNVPDEILAAQLRSWGLTGEPYKWAPTRWQPVIYGIRAANLGFGTQATVQGLLQTTFPLNTILASDVCVSAPTVLVHAAGHHINVGTEVDARLPEENIEWLMDGVVVGHGRDVHLPAVVGEHEVELRISVAGSVFSDHGTVDFGDAELVAV